MRVALYTSLLVVLAFAVLEVYSGRILDNDPDRVRLRCVLLEQKDPPCLPRVREQPYLNYIPAPGHATDQVQHNEMGFRGAPLPVERSEGSYRILFLGGSTTYGIGAGNAEEALPGQVGAQLSARSGQTPCLRGKQIETINAGLPFGTTAELFTHYHFKYRYFQPDLVVIHTGGNDAFSYILGNGLYQPDYNHWRGAFDDAPRPGWLLRQLMRSRAVSLQVINSRYRQFLTGSHYIHNGELMAADWLDRDDAPTDSSYNGFYNNVLALIREIRNDGAQVFLVPFMYNDRSADYPNSEPDYIEGIQRHNNWLRGMSGDLGTGFVEMDPAMIPDAAMWLDDCHLFPDGIRIKAGHIAEAISGYLQFSEECMAD